MSKELEIEYKTLLTKEEYITLTEHYAKSEQVFFTQTNHYFDTSEFDLRNLKCSLRIRSFKDSAEVTLKTPHPDGKVETTEKIALSDIPSIFTESGMVLTKSINYELLKLQIDPLNLKKTGSLTTKRFQQRLNSNMEIFLDESWYNNQHDYELEIEFAHKKNSKSLFKDFLAENNIQYKKAPSKIKRMSNSLIN